MSRYCETCGKAHRACICKTISPISSPITVWILQHPSEVNRAIGTARIVTLSLSNAQLWVGEGFSEHNELNQLLNDQTQRVAVLFPNDSSVTLNDWQQGNDINQIDERPLTLILLDGTWKKAYKMWLLSHNLHSLPTVALSEIMDGEYRIRKSPKAGGLSTVEACYYALSELDATADRYQPLLTSFHAMIDFQIQQMPEGIFERNYQ